MQKKNKIAFWKMKIWKTLRCVDILKDQNFVNPFGKLGKQIYIGQELNLGRPRGRWEFYHWTTDAYAVF